MIDDEGGFHLPLNRAALREGISDTLFGRDDDCQTWDAMADLIIEYLERAGIEVPAENGPARWLEQL